MKQLKSVQVCLHRNLCIFRKDISSTLNPQTKCFCYINSIQLRKMKQYLLSKYYISKVKSLEEIRITFIIGTPQMFIDTSFKILMKNINLNNN